MQVAGLLRNTMAQVALLRTDARTNALRDVIPEPLSMDEPHRRFAAMMSGLDIHYDLGAPLLAAPGDDVRALRGERRDDGVAYAAGRAVTSAISLAGRGPMV